jgi:hypothetical protein
VKSPLNYGLSEADGGDAAIPQTLPQFRLSEPPPAIAGPQIYAPLLKRNSLR